MCTTILPILNGMCKVQVNDWLIGISKSRIAHMSVEHTMKSSWQSSKSKSFSDSPPQSQLSPRSICRRSNRPKATFFSTVTHGIKNRRRFLLPLSNLRKWNARVQHTKKDNGMKKASIDGDGTKIWNIRNNGWLFKTSALPDRRLLMSAISMK